MVTPNDILTVQDSVDEHPQVEQSTRASKSGTFAGLAMAKLASRVTTGMKKFILNGGMVQMFFVKFELRVCTVLFDVLQL